MIRFLISLIALVLIVLGGVLTFWLLSHLRFNALELAGPVILVSGFGLLFLKKWALLLSRIVYTAVAGALVVIGIWFVFLPPSHMEYDNFSMTVLILFFALPAVFLNLPAVSKYVQNNK